MLLASDIPDAVLRERGFADFILYALVALGIIDKLRSWFRPEERKVSGKVQTEPAMQHAEQGDLDALTETVNSMREEITAQFREATRSGENRVAAITQDVNAEMSSLSTKIGDITKMITTALVDNAGQGEAINNLKATVHGHQQSITAIHRRIDDIMQQGRTKRTA